MKEFWIRLAKLVSLLGFLVVAGICSLMMLAPYINKLLIPPSSSAQ